MSDAALTLAGQSPGVSQDSGEGFPPLQQEMEVVAPGKWELKKLTQRHKDICALIAQGIKRQQIASICEVTPEYVTMLARQPKCIQYIQEMNQYAAVQLDAMFVKTVDVINEAMDTGSTEEKLRAARLQLEVTKRIGRPDPSAGQGVVNADERLLTLAERLTGLLAQKKAESNESEAEDAEFRELPPQDQEGA
jgi:hypothetical protein